MIVEFWFDVTSLRQALARAPEMAVEMEDMSATDTVPLRKLVWACGGDFEAFESGLDEDPTVREPKRLAAADDCRLYRFVYPEERPGVEAYRAAIEEDGVILSAATQGDGWTARVRFPDRDAFHRWRDRCEDAGLEVDVHAIYSQEYSPPERPYGLTAQQREALVAASDAGYFSIPREATLADLADRLDVSSQAASERLRRGMEALVVNALGDGIDSDHPDLDPVGGDVTAGRTDET